MYRHCIHCSAGLGANESLEAFPVGRTLAFDAERGRLWAVCASCGRWNLAPIEERWEAVEDAERSFADAPKRASTGTLAMAKLRDGTKLVRVGDAPPAEVAVRRYGGLFSRRRLSFHLAGGGLVVANLANWANLASIAAGPPLLVAAGVMVAAGAWKRKTSWSVAHRVGADESRDGQARAIRLRHMKAAFVAREDDGALRVELPGAPGATKGSPLVVRGDAATRLLTRTLPYVNQRGGSTDDVRAAAESIRHAGGAEAHLRDWLRARRRISTDVPAWSLWETVGLWEKPRPPVDTMMLEMALHEEQERRAMEGELRVLEAAWREAEEIAGIADRLAAQMGGVRLFSRGE
jgi:hypothetical protein